MHCVSQMDSLPSLPDIYFELVKELRSEDASVDRIGGLISRDLSMTAKVLQLVNSSFFGLPVHVNDAHHAAALLGLNTLKPLVLTASIFRQLEESRVSTTFLETGPLAQHDRRRHCQTVGKSRGTRSRLERQYPLLLALCMT